MGINYFAGSSFLEEVKEKYSKLKYMGDLWIKSIFQMFVKIYIKDY